MADEKTEEKTKQTTVPALERSAVGIAAHVAAVQDRQWDKERKVFKDPVIAMLALFTYAKITAALLAETEMRLEKRIVALEKRLAEFETRLTTGEKWRAEAEAQTADMVKGVEEMVANGSMPQVIEALKSAGVKGGIGRAAATLPDAPVIVDATVTPLKQPKKDEKNNGAA